MNYSFQCPLADLDLLFKPQWLLFWQNCFRFAVLLMERIKGVIDLVRSLKKGKQKPEMGMMASWVSLSLHRMYENNEKMYLWIVVYFWSASWLSFFFSNNPLCHFPFYNREREYTCIKIDELNHFQKYKLIAAKIYYRSSNDSWVFIPYFSALWSPASLHLPSSSHLLVSTQNPALPQYHNCLYSMVTRKVLFTLFHIHGGCSEMPVIGYHHSNWPVEESMPSLAPRLQGKFC